MWAISKKFRITEQKTSQVKQPWVISIFYNSQTIINYLKECDRHGDQALKIQIYQKAKKLVQQGYDISIRWVLGHSGVEGNEKADKAAK